MIVVGIGASAGGIEALRKLLSNLSPETGAAFVIIQHLSPDFKSIMEELLQKYTDMPIHQIEKDTLVEPNHIYLMPSNKTMTYYHGILKLHDRIKDNKLSLPIDDFLHSLGNELQQEAIGVILSGSGTDGSRGARTIKEQEGVVLVQSPKSAGFDGMPKALIELDIADGVFPPEELATRIENVIKAERRLKKTKKQSNNDREIIKEDFNFHDEWLDKIIKMVANKSNIPFTEYKIATLQRRSEKQMALNKFLNLKEYYHFLKDNDEQIEILYRDFLINVTRFFRDKEFFDEIKNTLIPKIFKDLKEEDVCRIWVVACSTGEEAYTIGMLVMEYLKENNLKHDFKIFASDVNKKCIQIATEGIYNSSISADIPLPLLESYFIQEGKFYRIKPHLREKLIFAIHDVISDPPFINMNLISCRNFLIYLKNETKVKILKIFYFSSHKDQHMVLGPSESLGEFSNVFNQPDRKHNIYKKEEADYISSRQSFSPTTKLWKKTFVSPIKKIETTQPEIPEFTENVDDPFSPYLIEKYVPKVVFLTKELDVLYLKGNFEAIFSLPVNVVKMNLAKMLPSEGILFFRDAVRLTIDSEERVAFEKVEFTKNGKKISTDIVFEKVEFPDVKVPLVKAEITYVEEKNRPKKEVKTYDLQNNEYKEERILRLEDELNEKNKNIQEIKLKLETFNEELNTSNQELMASNEELQSTNEELQSVNEELHTVNAELQYRNKALHETNNDTSNLLKTINIGTIFLDKDLRIRRFTKAITGELDLKATDIGRPITSFNSKLEEVDLEVLSKQVLESGQFIEQEIKNKDRRRFLLRIYPYLIEEKGTQITDGVVISLVDISEITNLKSSIEQFGHQFTSMLAITELNILFLDLDGNVTLANQAIGGYTPEELTGHKIYKILSKADEKLMKQKIEKAIKEHEEQVFNLTIEKANVATRYHFRICPLTDYQNNSKISAFFVGAIKFARSSTLFSKFE